MTETVSDILLIVLLHIAGIEHNWSHVVVKDQFGQLRVEFGTWSWCLLGFPSVVFEVAPRSANSFIYSLTEISIDRVTC